MPNQNAVRFPIRFGQLFKDLSPLLFIEPETSFVLVGKDDVTVRMSWAFRTSFPRTSVAAARHVSRPPLSRGVHGWAGRWLVNGTGDKILAIDLEPEQRARVLGFPVRLRQLSVSVEDPQGLAEALRAR